MDTVKPSVDILHLEDDQMDAELIRLTLEAEGKDQFSASVTHVLNKAAFLEALQHGTFDIILSDYRMPGFDGDEALKIAQELCPDVPFIMVTGELGEDRAIETLHRGATDYVLKDRMIRLVPAIERALAEAEDRRKRREAEREQRRLLEELRDRQAELAAIIQAMHDGIMVLDAEGMVVLVNQAEAEMLSCRNASDLREDLGFLAEHYEFEGESGTIVPVEDWPISRVMRGESVVNRELKVTRRDSGRGRHLSFSGRPVRDSAGVQILSVLVTHDITEQKRAKEMIWRLAEELEERVRQRTEQLERSNRELEFFGYSVAHDLKAPLRAIDSFTSLLELTAEEHPLSKKQREYFSHIRASADLAKTLIESLLTFSRTARLVPRLISVDMRALAEDAVQEQRNILGEDADRVAVTIHDLPPRPKGDPVLLHQVFANLVGNAFKFTRKVENPRIEIGANRNDHEIVYHVRDNGAGFPTEKAGELFQVFKRLHSQEEYEGTGVGLATVRKIVERHGGRVWAEGEESEGATFFFALPGEQ